MLALPPAKLAVPSGFSGTKQEMCEHVARYPAWVLVVVVPMWGATAFLSTWTAKRIGGRVAAGAIALLLLAAVLLNISMLPYPIWFKAIIVPAVAGSAAWPCFRPSKTISKSPEEGPATSEAESGDS